MKTLVIIRHGKSSWENLSLSDKQRPLLPKGINRTKKVAAYLQNRSVIPDKMVSSPARRALETAEIIALELNYNVDDININSSFYFEGSRTIYKVIKEFDDNWQTVFIFGHNPDFTTLVNLFLQKHLFHLPTTGAAIFEFDTDGWSEVSAKNNVYEEIVIPSKL